jgi:hypothetical protein
MGLVQRNEPPFVYVRGKWTPVKGGKGWPDYALITAAGTPSEVSTITARRLSNSG